MNRRMAVRLASAAVIAALGAGVLPLSQLGEAATLPQTSRHGTTRAATSAARSARARDPFQTISAQKPGKARRADPSGVAMPIGNLPGWRQVYANDFTVNVPLGGFSGCTPGSTVGDSICTGLPAAEQRLLWAYPPSYKDTSGHSYNPTADLSISHGELNDWLHDDAAATVVPRIRDGNGGNGMVQGAYVVRFRAGAVPGYKTAFLLWPESQRWPEDGEIDFPEGDLNSTITANMHWQGGTSITSRDFYATATTFARWHTAVIEWTRARCKFILDGKVVGVSTARIPDTPMYWVLQVETKGSSTSAGHLYIDWAVAYKPT